MHTRPIVIAAIVALVLIPFGIPSAAEGDAPTPIYLSTSYSFGERAADLVARLTPQQRASQLVSSQAPAITTGANPLLTDTFGGQTTLAAPASAGDTNVKVESTAAIAVGAKLTIDSAGASPETVTVTTVGTGPSTFLIPTLAVAASPGATNIKVSSTSGFTVGHMVRIDTGTSVEFDTVQTVGTAGAGGTGVTLDRSARARARSRRGGSGSRDGNHLHSRARERACVPVDGQSARRHPGLRLVERGAARDQRGVAQRLRATR